MLTLLAPFLQRLWRGRRARSRRGIVLAVVLWLMVVLVVVALGLAYDTQVSVRSLRNTDNQARAYYAALSGLERLAAELDGSGVYYTAANQTSGAASWPERTGPAERFRQDWIALQNGQPTSTDAPDDSTGSGSQAGSPTATLAQRFAVGARARQIASDGQPRLPLATLQR